MMSFRRFATAVALKPTSDLQKVSSLILPNGAHVAVLQSNQCGLGMPHVLLSFLAGSRHENYMLGERGLNHLNRRAFGLSSGKISGINITRSLYQIGAQVACVGSRERLSYMLKLENDSKLRLALEMLVVGASKNLYYAWELKKDVYSVMSRDIEALMRYDFGARFMEKLHEAAFCGPLSQSLYAMKYDLNNYGEDELMQFRHRRFTAPNCSLIACGNVGLGQLEEIASDGTLAFYGSPGEQGHEKQSDSRFYSREIRDYMPQTGFCIASIVWEGLPIEHVDQYALDVFMNALCTGKLQGTNISHGLSNGMLPAAVFGTDLSNSLYVAVSQLNMKYSDIGMAGFHLAGDPMQVGSSLVKCYNAVLRAAQAGLTDEQFLKAKQQLMVDVLLDLEDPVSTLDQAHETFVAKKDVTSISEKAKLIESVTLSQVNKVAARLFGSSAKKSMASFGETLHVPMMGEL